MSSARTRPPTFHAYGEAGYFGDDEYRVKAGVSGELVAGKLSGLVSGLISGYDGNVKNLYDGSTVNGYIHDGGRAKLLFHPR